MKKPKTTPTFVFDTSSKYKDHRSCDCVIRAISLATGNSWQQVFDDLCEIARPLYRVPNEKIVYERLMAKYGWVKHPMPKKDDGNRYTVRELIPSVDVAVVSMAHHLTCIRGGKVHDLWDCGKKSVGNYYTPA